MNPIKLSDERVREILAYSLASAKEANYRHMPSDPETASLAQAVLDLRTANAMLEHNCDEMAKSEEALRRSLDKAAGLVR